VKATGTLVDAIIILRTTMSATDTPRYFFGGKLLDHQVDLRCARCARKGVKNVMGRAGVVEGEVFFWLRTNARKLTAVVGFPELDRMGDGQVKIRNNWSPPEMQVDGFQLICSDCKSKPVVNAFDLTYVVGYAVSGRDIPSSGSPILIDHNGEIFVEQNDPLKDE
jgi:hypothetical protein